MRMLSRRKAIGVGGAALAAAAVAHGAGAGTPPKPLVFAHRGCSALRPEHTLGAYAKAIADGADYIEPDLVVTRDGVLVVRHENNIADTTDVAGRPEFAGRKTTRTIDGAELTGWFTEDFTLAELKTLRAIERLGAMRPESRSYDRRFQLLTFDEVIDFTAAAAATQGRVIGLVPELKHSTYFASIGLPLEDRFLAALAAHDYTLRNPVEVQSFEVGNLRYLRRKLGRPTNVRLLQLIGEPASVPPGGGASYGEMVTPRGLRSIAAYADVVAPSTRMVIPLGSDELLGKPGTIVADAHAAGLLIRVWTFRPENRFLAADFRNGAGGNARNEAGSEAEIRRYLATGIDGFFTDDPAIGRRAVDR
jgi:glycerophosphoryl diester phosphodiesterase